MLTLDDVVEIIRAESGLIAIQKLWIEEHPNEPHPADCIACPACWARKASLPYEVFERLVMVATNMVPKWGMQESLAYMFRLGWHLAETRISTKERK